MNTFEICRLIREAPKETLNGVETAILMVMALIGNREGKDISPGLKALSDYTKFSRSTLIRGISSLVNKKVLIVCFPGESCSNESACYEINVQLLEKIRTNNNHKNKSHYNKLYSLKVINDEKISVEPSVTETPPPSVTETLGFTKNSSCLVSQRHPPSVTETPPPSVTETPLPYIPNKEPISTISNLVKSGADSTSLISENAPSKISERKKSLLSDARYIFDYWKEVMNHPGAQLDEQRKRKIIIAREKGFSVEQLKKAIDGAKKSTFHMGGNDTGAIYDSIGLIFRNPEKIGEFIARFDSRGAVKNKNVATGSKLGFVERQKSQVNMLRAMGDKYFPEFSDNPAFQVKGQSLLTSKQEYEVNEHKSIIRQDSLDS